ncbi:uncharacterized protein LOC105279952 [Ooceraea biroi]|uniref:uncharacterized protein LOC105279952 n=1 Tax=Ooceraea biroi TaxID=2015173 RepID=UPI000F076942|nr:uncharacterized protein LOC105279952 [Ooceraea biroi]
MSSPTERHAEQLTTQQLMQHHPEVHTYPYYRMYHNPAPLNLAISHQSHHFTYLPKPAGHLHYMKVKGYGHTQHPMFVGLPYPLEPNPANLRLLNMKMKWPRSRP